MRRHRPINRYGRKLAPIRRLGYQLARMDFEERGKWLGVIIGAGFRRRWWVWVDHFKPSFDYILGGKVVWAGEQLGLFAAGFLRDGKYSRFREWVGVERLSCEGVRAGALIVVFFRNDERFYLIRSPHPRQLQELLRLYRWVLHFFNHYNHFRDPRYPIRHRHLPHFLPPLMLPRQYQLLRKQIWEIGRIRLFIRAADVRVVDEGAGEVVGADEVQFGRAGGFLRPLGVLEFGFH